MFKDESVALAELVHQDICCSRTEMQRLGRAVLIPSTWMTAHVAQMAGQVCALVETLLFIEYAMGGNIQCVGRGWGVHPLLLSSLAQLSQDHPLASL